MHSSVNDDWVILATAVVKVKHKSGDFVLDRALLDSGSQTNYVTEDMQIPKEEIRLKFFGVGNSNLICKTRVKALVKSWINYLEFLAVFWILKSIAGYLPERAIQTKDLNIRDNIHLADPQFYNPQKIDMLLGAETFFDLLSVAK